MGRKQDEGEPGKERRQDEQTRSLQPDCLCLSVLSSEQGGGYSVGNVLGNHCFPVIPTVCNILLSFPQEKDKEIGTLLLSLQIEGMRHARDQSFYAGGK